MLGWERAAAASTSRTTRPDMLRPGDDLERDGLVEGDIERLVHVGEPAAADLADQLIAVAPVSVERCGAVGRDGHSGSWDPSFGTVFGMVQSEPCKSCWASGGIGRRARFRV